MQLREVEIKSSFTPRTQGFKKVTIDSILLIPQLNADLSTILSQHSTVFIKTYGNGSLATPSMRGTTASHTQVEWNGININSPMLGQTDFSQIPVFQFNNIEILYGAAGIQKTSGAFGGVINLVTDPDWNNKVNVFFSGSAGSFDTYNSNLAVTAGNEKVQSITKGYFTSSQNDFPFYENGQKYYQKDGSYYYSGGSEEFFVKLNNKDFLSSRIWYNHAFLNLPRALSNQFSEIKETQENKDLYSKIEWKHLGRNNLLTAWTGVVDHFMEYINSDSQEKSINDHHSYSWLNKLRWSYSGWKVFIIKPGIDFDYDWVISDGYPEKKTRNTVTAFSEFILKYPEKFSFNLILREQIMSGDFLPLIVALGGEYDPLKSHLLSLSVNISKNYKYPTLNDLYWEDFGNPDLKPETDYAAEIGIIGKYSTQNHFFFVESQLSAYYSKMIDLIKWEPDSTSKWKPSNISEVRARGIEAGLNFKLGKEKYSVTLDNNYHFCRSTDYELYLSSSEAQLLYIPVHTFNTTLSVKVSEWYFNGNYCYISDRSTSSTKNSYMPGYGISNIIAGKNFHLKKILLSLQLQVNNLFDLDYQSITDRPMPGRNFAVNLKINFRK